MPSDFVQICRLASTDHFYHLPNMIPLNSENRGINHFPSVNTSNFRYPDFIFQRNTEDISSGSTIMLDEEDVCSALKKYRPSPAKYFTFLKHLGKGRTISASHSEAVSTHCD